ncbi:hypothetical protein A3H80_04375 [Candidatus Roizmanbacteria bacterium RIFCSPLOWO2_02_FULL_37_19]|uniref:Uncharacterized protein n=1 Tax=Candidatus Roizmanbacteria bacterium RIFCSPHIGHO2_02_FULL_37_24 TaxID=1802037 RepID=A0A1F7GWD5_9BACT|nr:MAG: hypothetical protein A2862_04005 [Candidatus Roizmanbacteria bacterium RIFCSPHIGHO2_01_FULL_38_41]OGK23125.1 MAG: hypothetical protein A3C24_01405 [Candidatus Roizmanbacteria bacterium RIFCSPHIGHO2_02_FULL_37_24]OGK32848.1 MAG: hypothetical protein A3E10_00065 [Candidatus Roizmanbacteria bacterium RIFCSPHIGHO2_12_FULL_37_23]OGK45475.1 MAG: hypothetical protein A2956_00095 [Candidatus Roizmanbacteria bacterium RIFCSPLOWO2_01_FULL_37_57]OGK54261.1 MAG: hypothetical protein A3H80_04375 [Ca
MIDEVEGGLPPDPHDIQPPGDIDREEGPAETIESPWSLSNECWWYISQIDDLTDEEVGQLLALLQERVDVTAIEHPFGHYTIPFFTQDPTEGLEDFEITHVPRGQDAVMEERKYAAAFMYPNKITLRDEPFTLRNRIKVYLSGRTGTVARTEEEVLAHEVRHRFFQDRVWESNLLHDMDEGFALATDTVAFLSREAFGNLHRLAGYNPYAIAARADYLEMFLLAQAAGIDEVRLVEYLVENDFFGRVDSRGDLYPPPRPRILEGAYKYMGIGDAEARERLLEEYRMRKELDYMQWHGQVIDTLGDFFRDLETRRYRAGLEDWARQISEEEGRRGV